MKDRKRRKEAEEEGKKGEDLQRRVPTAALYRLHQLEKDAIGLDSKGGLYRPIFLKHYLHLGFMSLDDIRSRFSKARPWHGGPLACLRRCFLLLGGGRLEVLEKKERFQLQRLHALYFLEDDYWDTFLEYYLATKTDSIHNKRKQFDETLLNEEPPDKKNRVTHYQGFGDDGNGRDATTFCPILQREVRTVWSLGPNASTEDAVRRYAPIFSKVNPSDARLCAT